MSFSELDPAAGDVEVQPQELMRALINLISNGFHAAAGRARAGGDGTTARLAVTTRSLGERVAIFVRDNGPGIPEEVRDKIFMPFFTTKPPGEGTGLGLSITHDIVVKGHGGELTVETEPGNFTEFRIVLPRRLAKPNVLAK